MDSADRASTIGVSPPSRHYFANIGLGRTNFTLNAVLSVRDGTVGL